LKKNKTIIVNSITISRVLSIIPIFFIESINYVFFAALWVSLSDFIDGFLARKWDVVTTFGAKLDQYADKLVSFSLLLFFLKLNQLSYSFVSIILCREVLVLIFRKLKWSNIQSNFIGKLKTFFLFTLFILLCSQQFIPQISIDLKKIVILLVLLSSLLSFILSISKFTNIIIYFLGTTGFTSLINKKAPGTISSFVVFLFFFVGCNGLKLEYKISVFLLLLAVHFTYYNSFLQQMNLPDDDPSIYTLDETLAIGLGWIVLGDLSLLNILIFFILFRFFDILKPLGIKSIEKFSNCSAATRNLADDILAMIYALIIFQIVKIYVV
jgi:CDP-diacylglycerol--glycerol-3-phosphate 3-phosphatidyltransferase